MAYNPAYPPTVPSNLRDNNTVMQNQHPQDHVQISNALSSLIGILGNDPFQNAVSGVTNLQQRLLNCGKVATIYVAARNASPQDKAAAQFVCDGVNDDSFYINQAVNGLAYALGASAADFGGIVLLSEGDFTFGTGPNATYIDMHNANCLWLLGKGPGVTIIWRTSDRPIIKMGGTRTGGVTTTRLQQKISGISFHGGSGVSTQPGIQMYYNQRGSIEDCTFWDFFGPAVEVVQGDQIQFRKLHFEHCGTRTGGNVLTTSAALHFLDSKPGVTAGEYGTGTVGSTDIHFSDLTFVDYNDGAIWMRSPGGFGHSKVFGTNIWMSTATVGGAAVNIDNVKWVSLANLHIREGSAYETATTPQDYISISNSTGVSISNYSATAGALTASGSPIVKSFMAMRGGNTGVFLNNLSFELATTSFPSGTNNYPTVACIDYSGTNSTCQVDNAAIVVDASAGAASVALKNRSATTSTKRLANAGTTAISAAATVVTVTHLLNVTPSLSQIQVTPLNSLGTAQKFWVDTVTSTTFNVNVDQVPGGTGALFSWAVDTRLPRGTGTDI